MSDTKTKTKKEVVRPVDMFKVMKQKVFQLLQAESKMNIAERGNQQWQLFFDIPNVGQFIVGKGGVNTMFYIINGGERKVCLPHDMLDKIDKWTVKVSVTTYMIRHDGKTLHKGLSTIAEAKKKKVAKGAVMFKVKNGQRTKIFVYGKSLFGLDWKEA